MSGPGPVTSRAALGDGFAQRVRGGSHPSWMFAGVGVLAAGVALASHPAEARTAAAQDWSPFVLVSGLLLIGLVADDDGLFSAGGHWLARSAPSGVVLFVGAAVMVGAVTAVLNVDTSVAFRTPVLVYTAW